MKDTESTSKFLNAFDILGPDFRSCLDAVAAEMVSFTPLREPRRLIKLRYRKGSARSIRSRNAFLDLKRLGLFLSEEITEGAALWSQPSLFFPIIFRMMYAAREAVAVDLPPCATAIVIVLFRHSLVAEAGIADTKLESETKAIMSGKPFCTEMPAAQYKEALSLLSKVGAAKKDRRECWYLADKIEIIF